MLMIMLEPHIVVLSLGESQTKVESKSWMNKVVVNSR